MSDNQYVNRILIHYEVSWKTINLSFGGENLIRYTQRLMAINFYDKKAVALLRNKIEKEENLTEKEWLIAQLG